MDHEQATQLTAVEKYLLDELTPEDVFNQLICARGNVPEERLPIINDLFREVLAEVHGGDPT